MRQNRDTVQAWIGLSEGGYVNHPDDPGGATDRGITQATFDAWNRLHGNRLRPVKGISKSAAETIIYEQYMRPVRFDDLPSGLDYAVVDFAVNSGPKQAALTLQLLLPGVTPDGIIGAKTIAAINAQRDIPTLIVRYCEARLAFMRGLKNWRTFKNGWTIRVMGNEPGVQTGDIGVIDRAVRLYRAPLARDNIPAPVHEPDATAKADPAETAQLTWWQKALSDPATLIPAVGGVITPLVGTPGPLQWALAAVIVLGAIYAVARGLQRGRGL